MSKKLEFEVIAPFLNDRSIRHVKVDANNYTEFWHFHPEAEITYVKKGAGIRLVGDNITSFKDGDLVLLGKNLPHSYLITNPNNLAIHESHALQFPTKITGFFPETDVLHQFLIHAEVGYYFPNPSDTLRQKILNFSQRSKHQRFADFFQILNLLYEDKNRIPISSGTFKGSALLEKKNSRISEVLSLLYHQSDSMVTIDDCAETLNMSKTYFCRWFKKTTGHTFSEYRNKMLIERFCQELLLSDDTISSLAFKLGFENIQNFNRTFKHIKGVSPTQYKEHYFKQIEP